MVDCFKKIIKNEGYAAAVNSHPSRTIDKLAVPRGCTAVFPHPFSWRLPRGELCLVAVIPVMPS